MHLKESSCQLTAFITLFGLYDWRILPLGVKVGPQVFQRLVASVVRNCPFSGPYINDVLTGTGSSVRFVDSDRGKGKRFDSHAYADRPTEEFLHPCFWTPPDLPDGSVNTNLDTPFLMICLNPPPSGSSYISTTCAFESCFVLLLPRI